MSARATRSSKRMLSSISPSSPSKSPKASKKTTSSTPLVRQKSDPSLRGKVSKGASKAPPIPTSQDDYDVDRNGTVNGQVKLISWNVNGLNAWLGKGGMDTLLEDDPQVICLQETKINQPDLKKWSAKLGDSHPHKFFSCCSTKKGYAGTAVLSKIKPVKVYYGMDINDPDAHEAEGRVLSVEFKNVVVVNTYVPNSGMKLENLVFRQEWDARLLAHMTALSSTLNKPVLWTGDLNVAHTDWDLAKPAERRNKVPGACDEERQGFDNAIEAGFVDLWREQHTEPRDQHFTFYSYKFQAREKNIGWRLDYWMLLGKNNDSFGQVFIRSKALGSDHVPLGLLVDPTIL